MTRPAAPLLLLGFLLLPASFPLSAAEAKPNLCVYDFLSQADKGAVGKKMAEIIRGHARRSGEYSLLVEIDREDVLEAHPYTPGLPTPATEIAAHAKQYFHSNMVIYGEVVAGGGDELSIRVKVLDVPAEGEPRPRHAKEYKAANKFELMIVADELLADLAGRNAPHRRDKALPIEYKVVSENLVPNPSFEQPDPEDKTQPARWVDASTKKQATWANRGDAKTGDRKCLVLHPDREMAESYGLIWYSDYIPVEQGAAYVLSMDLKSEGPAIIIWTKGYTSYGGEWRNSYKYQKRFYPEKKDGGWEHFQTEPFVPRNPSVKVEKVRIMLYAYLSPGNAYYDHVDLRKVEVTKGETRKGDFEDPTKSPEGWRQKKIVDGEQKDIQDPDEKKDAVKGEPGKPAPKP